MVSTICIFLTIFILVTTLPSSTAIIPHSSSHVTLSTSMKSLGCEQDRSQKIKQAEQMFTKAQECKVGGVSWKVFKPNLAQCRQLPPLLKLINQRGLECVRTESTNQGRNKCYEENVEPLQSYRVRFQDACIAIGWGFDGKPGGAPTGKGCEDYEKYAQLKVEEAKARKC